ncbi:MAG: avidin/streptavidin family protein, partial [Gammaproteobacteria bacterium]
PSALLEQLRQQGIIEHAIASFYFDPKRGSGSCIMGAADKRRFDPDSLNLLPLQPLQGALNYLWNLRLDRLEAGGTLVVDAGDLVLDTGSSRFKGGCAVIGRMLDAITYKGQLPIQISDPEALNAYPDIALTLGGKVYTLTPQQYFQHTAPSTWELGVHYLEGLPDELLLVGSVFLDSVYSIFFYETKDPGQRAVGLANPVYKKMTVSGIWQNEFGSTLEIGHVASDGTFRGTYSSHTGATGVYPVMGVADPNPTGDNLALSFSVTWHSLEGKEDPSWHWVSGFTGLLQENNGEETMSTTYLLQQNATGSTPDWIATAIYPSTFRRKS